MSIASTEYTFEKYTRQIGDSDGFVDVWKRHCFAWEFKRNHRNLVEAYAKSRSLPCGKPDYDPTPRRTARHQGIGRRR
jgi:hypothetical protein